MLDAQTSCPTRQRADGAYLVLAIVLPATGVLLSLLAGGTPDGLPPFCCPPASSLRPSFSSTCGEAAIG